jgi:ammonia channel protein AmtB
MDRAVVNTYLSIVSSCIAAFLLNVLMHPDGRVSIHVMQHATIAGGVAMGAAADMVVNPFGAMIIGFVAGAVAAVSLLYVTRMLDHSARIRDTCGVLSLHGLPGIIGAVASAIAAGARKRGSYQGTMDEVFPRGYESQEQAGLQMAGLGISLGFAMLGGLIAGAVLSAMPSLPEFFDDRHEYVKDHAAGTHGTVATTNTADQAVHTVANDAPHRDQILALESAHREPMHAGTTTGMTTTQTAVVPANTAVVPVSDTADVPAVRGRA